MMKALLFSVYSVVLNLQAAMDVGGRIRHLPEWHKAGNGLYRRRTH